jgi:hypothetical protein
MRELELNEIERQVENLRAAHPELWEDEDERLLADMLEGCTGYTDFMNRVARRIARAKKMVKLEGELIAELKARRDRYEKRYEGLRVLAFQAMQIAGQRKLELAQNTLSIKRGPPKVILTDEAALPAHCVNVTITPNKLVIKDRILHGETVPGAELSNGEDQLVVT